MAKKRSRFIISADGNTIIGLCDDIMENIPDLGEKHIERAADVEFNNDPNKKVWEIILPDGTVAGEHARRDKAIELEREVVYTRLKNEWVKESTSS